MMPLLPKDEGKMVRAQIYDLSEEGAKQVLYGMVQIFEQHPSILLVAFRLLIEDGAVYSEAIKNKIGRAAA